MPSTSTLEMAILGLLSHKPQSGYDVRKTFATTAMGHYSDSPGSIYPALRRLEKRGWISSAGTDQGGDRRRRQDFQLTETGRAVLLAWLEQDVTSEDVRDRLAELMLRFAFMDGNVPRSVTVRFLDRFMQELSIRVEEMHTSLDQMRTKVPLVHTGLLAFESGIRGMESQLAWAREARARLGDSIG
jgi:DNA-binding PadR family transcriptional regulator